jgi:[glutamine synthetase] adenylyltransferase / [glutamine synthetase]-adenylyl-L-tyrosine phosphorylase
MARKAKPAAKAKPDASASGLAARVREAPQLAEAKAARERLAELLKSDKKAGTRLKALLAPKSRALALIEGIADGSPFLWEIAQSDPAGLADLLEHSPEESLDRIAGIGAKAARTMKSEDGLMRALRKMRREAALSLRLPISALSGPWLKSRTP